MLLPNPDHAVVDPAKVREHLLSPTHPVGRFKAVVIQRLGVHWALMKAGRPLERIESLR
jgi:hypothetical protein